jgi:diguanylate cyclase (GGDEF)-like protein
MIFEHLQFRNKFDKLYCMDPKNCKPLSKHNSQPETIPDTLLDRRANELEYLLKASRELNNILDHEKLFSVFGRIIRQKIPVQTLSVFVYYPETETFKLVLSHGLGKLNFKFQRDEDPFWQNMFQDQPFEVRDGKGHALFAEIFDKYRLDKLQSKLWIPLILRGDIIGLLAIGEKSDHTPFDDFELYFLKQIGAHAAACMNTCRLYEERKKEKEDMDKTLQNLSLLYSIGKAMNYISDLKKLLQFILSQAIEITSAEKGSIMLYDPETDSLIIRVLAGLADTQYQEKVNNNEIKCRSFKPGEGIAGRVYLTARPMIVNNIQEDNVFIESETSFVNSIACIPMVVYSDVIGVINVTNKQDQKEFSDEDLQMLKAVADQAAVAVNKAQLWDMAVTDSLTGLYVRRYFMAKLQDEIRRAERYNRVISIVMADLDKFKNINDTYGHDAGDRVLQAIGNFLQNNIRDVDIVARYGGEEFVMMIPEADQEAAFSLSERLRHQISKIEFDDIPSTTISLGVATYPFDGSALEDLIKKADAAMYAAKKAGRNKVVKYTGDIKLVR